jgi:hypothetical protein
MDIMMDPDAFSRITDRWTDAKKASGNGPLHTTFVTLQMRTLQRTIKAVRQRRNYRCHNGSRSVFSYHGWEDKSKTRPFFTLLC